MNITRRSLVVTVLLFGLAGCCPLAGEVVVQDQTRVLAEDKWPPGLETAGPGEQVLDPGGWKPEVWAALSSFIRTKGRPDLPQRRRPVAVLDFDNTCLRHDLGRAVFLEAIDNLAFRFDDGFWDTIPEDLGRAELRQSVERVVARSESAEGIQFEEDPDFLFWRKNIYRAYEAIWDREPGEDAAAWLAGTFVGMTPFDIRSLTRRTLARHLSAPLGKRSLEEYQGDENAFTVHQGLRFYPQIRDLVGALTRHGFDVWIVSASNQWIVEVGAAYVGVPVDHVIGVRVERDADGRLTRRAEFPVTYGEGKVEAIVKFTGRSPAFVMGDGLTDMEMLASATDIAILLDKGVRRLRKQAEDEGWFIQPRFPVR